MKASSYDIPHPNHIQKTLSGKPRFMSETKPVTRNFCSNGLFYARVVEPPECERLKAERAGQENSERSLVAESLSGETITGAKTPKMARNHESAFPEKPIVPCFASAFCKVQA
jgi:hypothetical protein